LETEQAHSRHGRQAVPQWRDPRTAQRAVPTVWLNLVCLDAPIVAVVWLWLFARTFHVSVQLGNAVALFLTAWLIYLADRLADASSLKAGSPRSLRQEFCLRHREIWITALFLVAGFDLYVIWRSLAAGTFFAGSVVGVLALIYLALNYPRGLVWRSLPAKEMAIGSLFTAGTLVALLPAFPAATMSFVPCAIAFVVLCSLNCISIACWERRLDQAQGKVSIGTRHQGLGRVMGRICVGFALVSVAAAIVFCGAALIFGCIGVSALLLALLNTSGSSLDDDRRTALADLVLLTPVIALVVLAL
jgi:hypothetical protein